MFINGALHTVTAIPRLIVLSCFLVLSISGDEIRFPKSLPRMRNCNPPRKTELAYPELRLTEAFRRKSIPHLFIPSLWRGMNPKAIPRLTTRHTQHYFCVARS